MLHQTLKYTVDLIICLDCLVINYWHSVILCIISKRISIYIKYKVAMILQMKYQNTAIISCI